MRIGITATVACTLLLAARGASGTPPECRSIPRAPTGDASADMRAELKGLIPALYVRWRGRVAQSGHRTAPPPPRGPDRPESTRDERIRRGYWEVGLRWHPLDLLRSSTPRERRETELDAPRVDPSLCRRLVHLRERIESEAQPSLRTILEASILERRIEATSRHD